jgi:hypothetical protein
MAINQVQGSLILHEFRVAGTNDPYKPLVCAQGGGVDKNVETTTESTKCGPIVGVGDVTWTMSGDAVVNISPDTDQISYKQFNTWMVNKTKLDVRLMSPADAGLSLDEGEAFYEQGEGYITSINITTDTGSSVKFSWTFSGNGAINTFGSTIEAADTGLTVGETLTINSEVIGGTSPYTYQWTKGGVDISGATSATYTKANVQVADAGVYALKTTDANAEVITSDSTTVTVV